MPEDALPTLMSRHALVGTACALLNIGIMHVATASLGWPYMFAALLTCFVSFPLGYLLHRRHSFRLTGRANWTEFCRFLGQQFLQFCVGLALLSVGVEWLGLNPTLAMAAATAILWLLSFLVQWRWVFRAALRSGPR